MAQQRYTITGFVIDEDTFDFKDTTTGNATTTDSGFMSASDKVSLDDVVQAIGNVYTKSETDAAIAQSTAYINVGTVTENSTYTLTDAIKNSKLVSISFRRYGYCAAITMPTTALRNGPNNGTYATADGANRYMTFKCNNDVITILHDGLSSPTMEIVIVN